MSRFVWSHEEKRWVELEHLGRCAPDVYFKEPYWDEHLGSQEHPGAKYISSRAEKKYWMQKCNLREAGDRVRGSTSFDPISHRHAMDSLRRKGYGR